MRISEAGLALIERTRADGSAEYLSQWNDNWGMYSLVGGHVEVGETFRECCIREVTEELGLTLEADFSVAPGPIAPLREYVALSGSAKVETRYRVELYRVELAAHAASQVASDAENRWLTLPEVVAGVTDDGRPISAQVRTMFQLCGV